MEIEYNNNWKKPLPALTQPKYVKLEQHYLLFTANSIIVLFCSYVSKHHSNCNNNDENIKMR